MSAQISVKVEFGGGLELLFDNQRSHRVSVPVRVAATPAEKKSLKDDTGAAEGEGRQADVAYLILWLRDNLLKERAELFVENGTVRPGILVLVNDTDWELEGEGDYQLKDGDEIVFISTLHGG
ncbi:ubiquitin-like modifier 1 [Rhodofomes roseus]|uniref:Ubiquitin-related modifier 1 n=1 Tax=Rhodofomes roseus TaxID=34475 RepID=A0ABQ8KBY0_9APHY|nr:ubiquitin-like modifier 1 [Rhodofomes roseus]KAH9834943.1 ubiquitin-like modifier 1 [Rhodofomes roseus]